ncbi:HNH endonuclease [Streptomyces sp. H39-S7]|uniref:HNH endonuclease n=1 Tax=Streptomyces sp. H39-S7 TaxID=3004357 RepID=UPI003FA6E804
MCHRVFLASDLDVDHRVPLSVGGRDIDSNVRPLCRADHRTKTAEEIRARVQRGNRVKSSGGMPSSDPSPSSKHAP